MGMPTKFHYGDGMGHEPHPNEQGVSAMVIRHKRILSEHPVFIISSYCDGWFHDERWPYLREQWELWQSDKMNTLDEMIKYGEYFADQPGVLRKYRFAGAFHPFHGFSMMTCGNLAEKYLSATYIVAPRSPASRAPWGSRPVPPSRRRLPMPHASTPTATPTSLPCPAPM